MQNQPKEIIFLYFGSILFWMLALGGLWILGQRWEHLRLLRDGMRNQWREALLITIIYFISVFLSGRGFNIYAVAIFCQALIGLAMARRISDFEPTPVLQSILRRDRVVNALFLWILLGATTGVLGVLFGSVAMHVAQDVFHEAPFTDELMRGFSVKKFEAFFLFFAGAGIAEETTYRLLLLSLVWALTKRPWLAILVSAVFHSAYHLTPLNSLYLSFLQFPMSQLISGIVMGILWGYVFVKRGFETAVLGHTLSDWLPMLFFL